MEYFCCFNSYLRRTRNLDDAELGRLFRALMIYNSCGEKQELEGAVGMAYDFITDEIDRSEDKYRERGERRKKAIQAKKNASAAQKQTDTVESTNMTDCDTSDAKCHRNEKEKENAKANAKANEKAKLNTNLTVSEKPINITLSGNEREGQAKACPPPAPAREKRFVKPTLEEVKNYIRQTNRRVNAEHFFSFYESNGWRVGRNAMKDWRAAVRTWDSKQREIERWDHPPGRKPTVAERQAELERIRDEEANGA